MPLKSIDASKPILGYRLKEKIGAGGYGEVWAAEAPGGLSKAVKFIFGYHDEKRAQTELKSLNRIKEVRHPFLLSLERIDIVDGQMVVITELADMSVKERFDECVASGLKGIPRSELFGLLRDAADALDYISVEHQLQHLDIKPENLLLVGGHVKVADYGLVKDIHDGTQSLMGGLTPAFAPPELFDGRPSKSSDQYSLAIVYQEMLTGVRPFAGTTAAQLAAQHMHERPNLKSLPREDQATVSRALSKDPELRFPSCRALIDALSDKTAHPTRQRKSIKTKLKRNSGKNSEATITLPEGTHALAMRPAEIKRLDSLDVTAAEAHTRPTLVIGIGNTGTQILRRLGRRFRERVGERSSIPSIAMLCIDTDRRDLAEATRGGDVDSLANDEVLAIPLRTPEEYRSDAKMHLNWLSRRWIYNVPRSLQTEGIRPLGRLAFADNHKQLFFRLRQLLSEFGHTERLAETANTLGMDPQPHPRVFLVGSISGGVCSGSAIDIAYAVRATLCELGMSDDDVVGLFTHSTVRSGPERQLTVANALAFLSEVYHYSCVEEYPGDDTCGIPAFLDDRPTFGSVYLAHIGNDLSQTEYEVSIERIAEYLFQSSATPCSAFLDRCRSTEPVSPGLALRTFGLSRTSTSQAGILPNAIGILRNNLINTWTNSKVDSTTFDAGAFSASHLQAMKLATHELLQTFHSFVLRHHSDPNSALTQSLASCAQDGPPDPSDLQAAADEFFGRGRPTGLEADVDADAAHYIDSIQQKLVQPVIELVNVPQARFAGAKRTTRQLENLMATQAAQFGALAEQAKEKLVRLGESLISADGDTDLTHLYAQYAQLQSQIFTLDGLTRLAGLIKSRFGAAHAQLAAEEEVLHAFSKRREDSVLATTLESDEPDPSSRLEAGVLAHLRSRIERLVDRVEQQLQHGVLQSRKLRELLADEDGIHEFGRALNLAAQTTVIEDLKEIEIDQFFEGESAIQVDELISCLRKQTDPALLSAAGGSTRVLLSIPERSQSKLLPEAVKTEFEQAPTVIAATAGDVLTCCEVESVPLDNVSMSLLQDRPDSIDLASRLHARTDVSWCPLSSIR